jgi:hypothetical protein
MGNQLKVILIVFISCLGLASLEADDERLFIGAKVNGQLVRFALDTGTSFPFVLFPEAAQKLNLEITSRTTMVSDDRINIPLKETAPQNVDFGCTNLNARLMVLEIPSFLKPGVDGVLGWQAFSNNIVSLDCATHTLCLYTGSTEELRDWTKGRIHADGILTLELPAKDGHNVLIALDSGSDDGVELNSGEWRSWYISHAGQPMTLDAYYSPMTGLVVSKEGWAKNISLGTLTLTDVPVIPVDSSQTALNSSSQARYVATLGFMALKRLDIILDGIHGVAYVRAKKTPSLPFEYNHLGAVFVPHDLQSDDLVAHVIGNSPAYNAGIRDGDILLKIGNLDCTKWRTDPNVLPLSRFFTRPSGTALELSLKRNDKLFKTTAVLQNILPPDKPEIK